MDITTLVIFIPACFALNLSPGPNNLLAMANAKHYGLGQACLAGVGRLCAFSLMIFLAASGLATVLYASELLFFMIKVFGACYLFWLAFQLWKTPTSSEEIVISQELSLIKLMRQEFLLAVGNPKAILIFTAFLPQFINPKANVGEQFFILGAAFLMLEWLAIAIYAYFGLFLRHWFSRPEMKQLFNRSCSTLLAGAGISLLAVRRD